VTEALAGRSSTDTSLQVTLTNLTFVLAVFCYLKLIPITAEIQPFAAVPALALILLCDNPLRAYFVGYAAVLTAALVVSVGIASYGDSYMAMQSVQSYAAILAPVIIFVAMLANAQHLSTTVVTVVIAIWTFIGFSQAYAPALQSALGLDTVLSSMISRYSPVSLADWGRGATLLSPEPSYSAHSVLLLGVTVLYLRYRNSLSRRTTIGLLTACLFLAFVNQSATMAIILLAYAALLLPLRQLLALGGATLAALLLMDTSELRFVQVARLGYEFVAENEAQDVIAFTNLFGSMRTISVAVAYTALLTGRLFGGGLGSWTVDSLNEMARAGIDTGDVKFFTEALGYIVEVKPYSHLAMLAFELGILGVLLDVSLIWKAHVATRADNVSHDRVRGRFILATVVTCLVFIAFANPVSAPEFWVALALAFNLRTLRTNVS
jgi:hypothetical protein